MSSETKRVLKSDKIVPTPKPKGVWVEIDPDDESKSEEKKDSKLTGIDHMTRLVDLGIPKGHAIFGDLLGRSLGRGAPNDRIYKFTVSGRNSVSADGSGITATSLRYGDPSLWTGSSTYTALFIRFRTVHATYWFVPATGNAGTGGSGVPIQQVTAAIDPGATSLTFSSHANAWAMPTCTLVNLPSDGGAKCGGRIAHALSVKVHPEQNWYDLSAQTQLGVMALYATNATVSAASIIVYWRLEVEFQGLLL